MASLRNGKVQLTQQEATAAADFIEAVVDVHQHSYLGPLKDARRERGLVGFFEVFRAAQLPLLGVPPLTSQAKANK